MKRGDVVTVAAAGDYGKPRPAPGFRTFAVTVRAVSCPNERDEKRLSFADPEQQIHDFTA